LNQIDYTLSNIPGARFVDVDEIASMVSWLVTADNFFATASTIDFSGGGAT